MSGLLGAWNMHLCQRW